MRHIIPISGKDSLATAIWQTAREPDLPYEFVFNDTRAELPETYAWLDRVEAKLGISITRIGKSLETIIRGENMLPSARARFCTRLAKIAPMDAFIGDDKAVAYFGLRADEPDRIGAIETKKMFPKYPLREAGIGLTAVYRIVVGRDLLPPAFLWQRLFAQAIGATGEVGAAIVNEWPEWMRNRVFAWRSRPNCFFCFFQRLYEWVGLLEHHPLLFAEAENIETTVGSGDRRESGFFWIADYPLPKVRANATQIFKKRLDAVCKLIDSARQAELFESALDEMDIAGTSCGMLCGK